ncbi:MAG: ABC transporter ATP-binding protein, partial [Actinomycetota bacterium]
GPKLVILDEPCSALDPGGRVEVLDLITRLAAQATVIFSSHILADVQRVCTRVGVLRDGRLLYQGSLQALLDEHVGPRWIALVREPASGVVQSLQAEGWVKAVTDLGGGRMRIEGASRAEGEERLAGALDRAGARLVSVELEAPDLEAIFLSMTGKATGKSP